MGRDSRGALLLRAAAPPDARRPAGVPRSFGEADDARLSRFTDGRALLLRLQARRLLERGLEALGLAEEGISLVRSPLGAPLLVPAAAALSFSHADRAFCLLCPAGPGERPRIGLDCETLREEGLPPASVLSAREREFLRKLPEALGDGSRFGRSEIIRRWCVREAVLKAHGVGLRLPPSSVDAGPFGGRRGACAVEGEGYAWRSIPMQGTWVCVAADMAHAALLDRIEVVEA